MKKYFEDYKMCPVKQFVLNFWISLIIVIVSITWIALYISKDVKNNKEIRQEITQYFENGNLMGEKTIENLKKTISENDIVISNNIRNGLNSNSKEEFLVLNISGLSKWTCTQKAFWFNDFSDEILINNILLLKSSDERVKNLSQIISNNNLERSCDMLEKNSISFVKYLN